MSSFYYDAGCTVDDLLADVLGVRPSSLGGTMLFWLSDPSAPRLHDCSELKECGYEYQAPVRGLEAGNDGFAGGDIERRNLFLSVVKGAAPELPPSAEPWHRTMLRRMSCHCLERVMSFVSKRGLFSSTDNDHRNVLFAVHCGLKANREYKHLPLFNSDHPMVPQKDVGTSGDSWEALAALSWENFYTTMTTQNQAADKVAVYGHALIKFLIPSYIYLLGSIPDPGLWEFGFTSDDIEQLYHGDCPPKRMLLVTTALEIRNCHTVAKSSLDGRAKMWNLAYSTHVLLWGLSNTEARFRELLETHQQ
jgi:hypothetical protein